MKKLHISKGFKLPPEAVTQTFAVLAMRGVGKTYTASVLAEEFCNAGLPFAVLDPTGAWWGLRASADGKDEGYPVMIIGGDHADAPLEETAGKVIADMLVEDAPPLVIDLSHLSKGAMRRFVVDFAERLYHKNREPLHLIIDEADAFCPQRTRADTARMVGAIDEIVRRGRIRGLGCTLVTQRSAVLNKDVLTQVEVLVVLRTAHPRDRAPVLEWMNVHATSEQLAEVEESLANLPVGDAWVMSAGWLDLFKRVHVRERHTFNSSATPVPGERRKQPRVFARIDPEVLQERLAEAIERQQASDPTVLRRRITALERELNKKNEALAPEPEIEYIEVPVIKEPELKRLETVAENLREAVEWVREQIGVIETVGSSLAGDLSKAADSVDETAKGLLATCKEKAVAVPPLPSRGRKAAGKRTEPKALTKPENPAKGEVAELTAGERKVLTAVAQHGAGVTRNQLTVLTGYKRSTRDTYLQKLRARGLVEVVGATITATEDGIAALGPDYEPLPTGPDLLDYWLENLPAGERACLEVAVEAYPESVRRDAINEETGYKRSSRDTYLQKLRSRQLITEPTRGEVRVSDELF